MPTNSKEYMNDYMKQYNVVNSYNIECLVCGTQVRKCYIYMHNKTKKHVLIAAKVKEAQLQLLRRIDAHITLKKTSNFLFDKKGIQLVGFALETN